MTIRNAIAATARSRRLQSRWETGSRLASAFALIVLIVGALWYLPPVATTMLVVVTAAMAGAEVASLSRAVGAPVPTAVLAIASGATALSVSASVWPGYPADLLQVLTPALVVIAGAVVLATGAPSPGGVTRAAVLFMAPIYVGVPLGLFSIFNSEWGGFAATWVLAVVAVSDSAQYFAGRAFGRRKLAPLVSPGKTVEGLIGGLVVVSIFGALTFPMVFVHSTAAAGVGLALALALAGVVGDLFESFLKRSAGVKDSSSLIPGHGGVLDRIDSHLFAAPAFYLYARYLL